jgi:monofunctional biosynthetic peptidoglycan transglycosylase
MSVLLMATLLSVDAHAEDALRLYDFSNEDDADAWYAINDGVMGGISSGRISRTDEGTVTFEGRVSLENNGGFASVRSNPRKTDLGAYDGLRLSVRGDGQRYKINLKTDASFDGLLYRIGFDTQAGQWQTVEFPFGEFEPTYRGRVIEGAPALDLTNVTSLGLMISDKQAGPFALELRWIDAFVGATKPRIRSTTTQPEHP